MAVAQKLTNAQLEILKLFKYDLSEEQLSEIKELLVRYFADKITDDMDQLFKEQNWDETKIEEWANEHMRTKYHS